MNLTKRVLACTLAVATVFSMVGCGKDKDNKNKTTTTTVKATLDPAASSALKEVTESGELEGALPEIELANKEVKWLAHYAMNPNDDQAAAIDLEIFKQVYGGKVIDNVTTWDARYDDLAKLVSSGKSPDLFPAGDMDAFPKGAIRGMFQPIDDYIDFDNELWADVAEAADKFAIKDDHYVAVIDVTPSVVCVYNTKTIKDNGLDDPAELFANGEWTLDKFEEMCKEFTNHEEEKYGLDGYWYYDAIQQTTGVPMIDINEDGEIINNMENEKIVAVEDRMYELSKSGVCFPRKDNDWKTRGSGETGEGLGDGKTLFIPVGLYALQMVPESTKLFGDVENGEVMFVPMPLNEDNDNDTHYISANMVGYVLCKGAPNPEGFAALMNVKRFCNMNETIDEISKNQVKDNYKWTDEMLEMEAEIKEMALDNPVFEFHQGVDKELATLFSYTITSGTLLEGDEGTKSWTTIISEQKGTVDWYLNDANAELAKLS